VVVKNFLGAFGHVAMDYIVSLRRLPSPNTSIEILDRSGILGGRPETSRGPRRGSA